MHPGTTPGDPEAIHQIDNWWDLIVYHGELFDRLGLSSAVVVGHSFGGMLACEIAATTPGYVDRLVLIDPLGLWRDDRTVKNWMILSDEARREALFADPNGDAPGRFFALPEEAQARAEAQAAFIWSQACTGKFVWPIPDMGLRKHLHRVAAPTLIVWGKEDAVISSAYADDFAAGIAGARVELIECTGHLPHLEQPAAVAGLVREFAAKQR
jgi:pimeloyl-ACP methyl ester carboxylesterase